MSSHTLTLTNDLAEIPRLAAFVEEHVEPLAPTAKDMMSLQLALEETVTNVINHGYTDGAAHSFLVTLTLHGRLVTAVIRDDAPAYDPLARPDVNLDLPLEDRPIGGLGIHLVKNLMDHVRYERVDGHNVLTLELNLAHTTS